MKYLVSAILVVSSFLLGANVIYRSVKGSAEPTPHLSITAPPPEEAEKEWNVVACEDVSPARTDTPPRRWERPDPGGTLLMGKPMLLSGWEVEWTHCGRTFWMEDGGVLSSRPAP